MAGTRRVYLPLTWQLLEELDRAGEVTPPVEPVLARIVDDQKDQKSDDEEEVEYAALQQAADLSAGLLDGPGRRVVVVAEVPAEAPVVALRRVVAVHVDDADIDPAYLTDDTMCEPPDLGWWATQELPGLLGHA